jgi:hypothetical protein
MDMYNDAKIKCAKLRGDVELVVKCFGGAVAASYILRVGVGAPASRAWHLLIALTTRSRVNRRAKSNSNCERGVFAERFCNRLLRLRMLTTADNMSKTL